MICAPLDEISQAFHVPNPLWSQILSPIITTLPGTNMEVENGPLEDHFPLQTGGFPLPR